ncbi:DUF2147 domain-containing protein [Mucilaginibacter antarcticus]|uniref:DUF2147 domain-containing protein n=1 Tax=Mucilaginibacter antarcticus TaxID=1855725 RepID=UPI0036447086
MWTIPVVADDTQKANLVCGKWLSDNKELLVLIYRDGNTFKGKSIWFKNKDTSKDMGEWTDKHNPNPALRTRKIMGIDILTELTYNAASNTWENGKIYDSSTGKLWSTYVKIDKAGKLKATAYWGVKFLSKSITFTRYNGERLAN